MKIAKIVPGGQTVVDRGAIEAAFEAGFPYGGLIPWNAGTVTNFFIHAPEDWQVLAGKDVQEANSIPALTTTP